MWLLATITVVIVAAGLFAVGALTSQWRYEEEARQAANYYADDADRRERQVCIPGPGAQLDDCLAETRDAERSDQRAEYDLEAQRTSALWTAIMGWMSSLAVGLSAIGVYLIYRTFRQTLAQAAEIERSVNEASRSATAMEGVAASMAINAEQIVESVAMQRRFGEMHLRAHIDVQIWHAIYQDETKVFEAIPRLLNTGNSTAQSIRWRIAAAVLPAPLPDGFRFKLPANKGGSGALASQQDGTMSALVDTRVLNDQVEFIKRGDGQALYVWGYVSYDDGFRRIRRRTFAQQLWWLRTGESNPDGTPKDIVRGCYLSKHNRGN